MNICKSISALEMLLELCQSLSLSICILCDCTFLIYFENLSCFVHIYLDNFHMWSCEHMNSFPWSVNREDWAYLLAQNVSFGSMLSLLTFLLSTYWQRLELQQFHTWTVSWLDSGLEEPRDIVSIQMHWDECSFSLGWLVSKCQNCNTDEVRWAFKTV